MDKKTWEEGQEYSNNVIDSMQDILNELVSEDDNKHEEAIDHLSNYGLSISKETVINYLISWGGPAYRLQITFNKDNKIVSIMPQYADWGTSWTSMNTTYEQDKTLKEFVNNLCLEETLFTE